MHVRTCTWCGTALREFRMGQFGRGKFAYPRLRELPAIGKISGVQPDRGKQVQLVVTLLRWALVRVLK